MPRHAADLEEALNKKGGLTLSQLANYDDIITDALVDRVYYWSTIRKLKANYHPCRGVQEDLVCKILQDHVIIEKDPIEAHHEILTLPGIAKFYKSLRTDDEKEHFERHLRKYINIYLPDCPFDVGTTNRYTITTAEACIKARKHIKQGESIKYLSGIQVEMSEREEKELSSRTDFSIVVSSRRKRPSLFLGPARFANHDCDSNARLSTTGAHGIHIVARRSIAPGDEITVTYGEDYFGIDNCECLCATCEGLERNGWDPLGPVLPDSSDEEESDEEEEWPPRRGKGKAGKSPFESRATSVLGKRKRNEVEASSSRNVRGRLDKDRAGEKNAPGARKGALGKRKRDQSPMGSDIQVSPRAGQSVSAWSLYSHSMDILDEIQGLLTIIGGRRQKGMMERGLMPRECGNPLNGKAKKTATPGDLFFIEKATEERLTKTLASGAVARPWGQRSGEKGEKEGDDFVIDRGTGTRIAKSLLPDYAAMLVNASSEKGGKSGAATSSRTGTPLSGLKKEANSSPLRNVVNADDANIDIYDIPPSPSPPPAKRARRSTSRVEPEKSPAPVEPAEPPAPAIPKRGRGRPPKNRPSAENTSRSTSSNSTPPRHDNSSEGSQASSLTSVDAFEAGNIAFSICQMLTTSEYSAAEESAAEERDAEDAAGGEEENDGMDIDAASESSRHSQRLDAPDSTADPPIASIEPPLPPPPGPASTTSTAKTKRGPPRTPADYTLTPALLTTPDHRWVECRNCDAFFLQSDAYLTRIACPHCERHSKLYGYHWPKTDREGKWDRGERVLDHRTIHRFLEPEEERGERKGRRGLVDVRREIEREGREGTGSSGDGERGREEGRKLRVR